MKNPVITLQENASEFFDKIQKKHSSVMECKAGCSKCCMTDISVFEIEADRIIDYVNSLEETAKTALQAKWKEPVEKGACTFLYEGQCSIYEARPLICRTQGLPLYVATENVLDYCPLNFKEGDPEKADWLNLERMNTLLSFAAKTTGREARVRLKKLKEKLLNSSLDKA